MPAYREQDTIDAVVRGASPHGLVIVVDDGSGDATAERAAAAGAVVVRHDVNRGYDRALQSGFAEAAAQGVDLVATMDADAQHEPGLLPAFIAPIVAGEVDLVIGRRSSSARSSERCFNAYTRARFGVDDILCGMKSYRMSVYLEHAAALDRSSIGTGLALAALRGRASFVVVPVPIRPRVGSTRFGVGLRANGRILRALGDAVLDDLRLRVGQRVP